MTGSRREQRHVAPGPAAHGAGLPALVSAPVALVAGTAASLLVLLTAALVWRTSWPDAVDAEMMRWQEAARIQADGIATAVANAVGPSVALAVPASAAVAWRARRWDAVALALIAVPATLVIEVVLKHVVHRQRPDAGVALLFPSGHVAAATAAALAAVLVLRAAPVRQRTRVCVAWAAAVVVALVAAARLVQTVHYLTDVVGGAALGIAVACWTAWAITAGFRSVPLPGY